MSRCEWSPADNRPALYSGDSHKAEATISVGTGKNNWHLCASCAALPRFKRLRRRVPLGEQARAKKEGR